MEVALSVRHWLVAAGVAIVLVPLGLWGALPALVAPVAPPPASGGISTLARHLQPGPPGSVVVALPAAGQPLAFGGPYHGWSTWLTLRGPLLTVHLQGTLPPTLGLPRLAGQPISLAVTALTSVPAPGIMRFQVQSVRAGRLPLTAVVSPARLLRAVARRVNLPSWVRVQGDTVEVRSQGAPPLPLGTARVRLAPQAFFPGHTTDRLRTGVQVEVLFPTEVLQRDLSAATLRAAPDIWRLQVGPGSALLRIVHPAGTPTIYRLTPTVPRQGVLTLAVHGAGAQPARALWWAITGALGRQPPWLASSGSTLTIDTARAGAIRVNRALTIHPLPVAVHLGQRGVDLWLTGTLAG